MRLTRRAFVATSAAALVARPAVLRAAGEKMVIGCVPVNAVYWDIHVAYEKGMLRDAGFDPEIQTMQSSPASVQQVIAGSYQMGGTQPESFIQAVERGGGNLAAIAAPANKADWLLVANKEINTIADLKGKNIGVSTINTGEAWMTRQILEKGGLKKGDYEFFLSGVTPQKVSGLQKGSIAAAPLFQPSAELTLTLGFKALARYSDVRTYPPILYVVTKEWAARDDNGVRFSAALKKAHAWLWDKANRAEAVAFLMKWSKREQPIIEKMYEDYFGPQQILSRTGEIEMSGLERTLADMAEENQIAKPVPPGTKYVLDPKLGGQWV